VPTIADVLAVGSCRWLLLVLAGTQGLPAHGAAAAARRMLGDGIRCVGH
jgi:hypothetical protein